MVTPEACVESIIINQSTADQVRRVVVQFGFPRGGQHPTGVKHFRHAEKEGEQALSQENQCSFRIVPLDKVAEKLGRWQPRARQAEQSEPKEVKKGDGASAHGQQTATFVVSDVDADP
jgi:hypothetical protein